MDAERCYEQLLLLVDTRGAGEGFPDMLDGKTMRLERVAELGLPEPSGDELTELVELRDDIVAVVFSDEHDAQWVGQLNALVTDYAIVPELSESHDLRFRSVLGGRVARVAETVVAQVFKLVVSGDHRQVQICAADDCAAPFVARATPRQREYCSNRCSTRVRVRRHRATLTTETGADR